MRPMVRDHALALPLARGGGDRSRSAACRPRRLSRRVISTSSMSGMSGKPPSASKTSRRTKRRLIPGGDAGQTRAEVHEPADQAKGPARIVQAHVEAPAHHAGIRQRARDGALEARGQDGVGVEEEEHVAPRRARARVHLARAPALAGEHGDAGHARGDLAAAVVAARVGHDDLGAGRLGAKRGEQAREVLRLAERGHDDGEHGRAPSAGSARPAEPGLEEPLDRRREAGAVVGVAELADGLGLGRIGVDDAGERGRARCPG